MVTSDRRRYDASIKQDQYWALHPGQPSTLSLIPSKQMIIIHVYQSSRIIDALKLPHTFKDESTFSILQGKRRQSEMRGGRAGVRENEKLKANEK